MLVSIALIIIAWNIQIPTVASTWITVLCTLYMLLNAAVSFTKFIKFATD